MNEKRSPNGTGRELGNRVLANPVARILLGSLLVWLPAPLVTKTAHALVPAPYGHLWPMVLASVLVYLAYGLFVRRVERLPSARALALRRRA
jgi:uncharacterized RDD family membrane protein YckC